MTCPSKRQQNFCLPVNLDHLQNDRLRLVPIESCTDANLDEYITETCIKNPELWKLFPVNPFESVDAYKAWFETIRHDPAWMLFAIYLKAGKVSKRKPGSAEIEVTDVAEDTFAGTTGLLNASAAQSFVEIGFVMILPRFHRTFVQSVANCLLLKHMLDPVSQGDLQMRRVQWLANSMNKPSIAAAERLGFTFEGITRWHRVIAENKVCASEQPGARSEGKPVVDIEGRKLGPGRHTAVLSLCWDDWLDGKREHVLGLLARA